MATAKKKTVSNEPNKYHEKDARKEGQKPIRKGREEGNGREIQKQPIRKEEEKGNVKPRAVSKKRKKAAPKEVTALVPFFSTIPAERIAKVAHSWVGTPYLNQHAMKGRGADCLRFFIAFYREFGLLQNAKIPHYNIHGPVGPNLDTLSAEVAKHPQFVVDETRGINGDGNLRPKPGTLIAVNMRSFLHTAVVLASWRHGFIHVFPNRPCKIEPCRDYWGPKILKAWVPMV